jgi:predicted MFS family arabinose efflux permease
MGALTGVSFNLKISVISIILYICIYLAQNLRKPMEVSYVAEMMKQDVLATGLSVQSQASSLAAAVVALLIGFFADQYGIGSSLIIVSLMLLLTTPFYLAKEDKNILDSV